MEDRINRVKCSKCHNEIEDIPKTKFKLAWGNNYRVFRLCPNCQPSYFGIIEDMRVKKEKAVEEFLGLINAESKDRECITR